MAPRRHAVHSLALHLIARKIKNVLRLITVLIVIASISLVECKDVDKEFEHELNNRLKIVEAVSGRSFLNDVYQNGTFRTGNKLWDNILNECSVKPSVKCLQKNFYSYLDDHLGFTGDVNVTSGVVFKKNNVDINKYSKEANIIYLKGNNEDGKGGDRSFDEENEIAEEEEPDTPLEEVTDALYDKGLNFLATHDMRVQLPELFFHGATLRLSPRALTKTGALVHVDLEPRVDDHGEGRIFFKKIKKYLKKKLVMAALAIILVVKLIALKFVFVLPVIFGVTTAKKMFLKLLLFLFPALSHIFKLCSWYHNNYHTTKFHHHHHLITHHHKYPHGPHGSHGHSSYPSLVVKPHIEGGPPPSLDHFSPDWELSGPGLGSEYIAAGIHRNAISNFKPHENDINDINAWGLGLPPGQSMNVGEYASSSNVASVASAPQKSGNGGPGRPVGPPINPYFNNRNKKPPNQPKDPLAAEKEALIRAAALAARAPPSPVRDEILRVSAVKLTENNRIKTETELVRQQQKILAAQDPDTQAAEKFYGALLEKVDGVLSPLGATDIGCKERAICALYQDPFKHAPYSNLVSNELSKNTDELLPPVDSKNALLYYRYVQAARDGQEQKDCISLYPQCNIDYNKKKK